MPSIVCSMCGVLSTNIFGKKEEKKWERKKEGNRDYEQDTNSKA